MADSPEKQTLDRSRNRRVHMANERTFLAWIRTSIGIMAFGFVVERFALFMKQFSFLLEQEGQPAHIQFHGHSSLLGTFLVAFGVLLAVFSFIRYKKVQQEIDADRFHPSSALSVLLALSVIVAGVVLIIFLLQSL